MISEKENFYRMINGQEPEFVPSAMNLLQMVVPSATGDRPVGNGEGYDGFGVHWITEDGSPAIPDATQEPLLEDIADWREDINWPDLAATDWEACYKRDVPERDPEKLLLVMLTSGPFERMHDLMGFEEALIATISDPDECKAYVERFCDFRIQQLDYLKRYYNPDIVHFEDDWGTQIDLMFNPEFWHYAIEPNIKRVVDHCHELGMLFNLHTCGKVDRIIDGIVDLDIDMLDSMMVCNDLDHWMDAYGHKLIFMGGLDAQGVIDRADVTKEEIRAEVEMRMDRYASKGYYIPMAYAIGPNMVETLAYATIYGITFYNPEEYAPRVQQFMQQLEAMAAAMAAGEEVAMGGVIPQN